MQHSYSAPMLATRSKQPSPLSQPSSLPGTSQFSERERVRRASSYTALDAVPEDSQHHGNSRRRPSPQPTHMKGKDRVPREEQPLAEPSARWVLDMLEAQKGRDRWLDRARVVLVLGDVTPDLLAPLLHNPSFQHTLILVASPQPILAIEALISRKADTSKIYPTLKPFSLKSCDSAQHALPALLDHAVDLSAKYRIKNRKIGRRESSTPPLSPPMRPTPYQSDSRASLSDSSDDRRSSAVARPGSYRESLFGRVKSSDAAPEKSSSSSVTFDAVLNFLPRATEKSPQAALQQLLHQAVLTTTGVFPLLCRKSGHAEESPVTLLHIVQSGCPGPLPSVIESFLLNFVKSFPRGDRAVWAAVAPPSVWLSPSVSHEGEEVSGAEVVLMGGVRCPAVAGAKPKAWIGGWSQCLPMPGLLSAPGSSTPTRLDPRASVQVPPTAHVSTRESQWTGGYSTYGNLSPANRSPEYSYPTPPSTSGHSSPIPELDGAQSSASSTASLEAPVAETPVYDRWQKSGNFTISNVPVDDRLRQSGYGIKPVTIIEEKKGKWWKRKTSSALKA